MKNQYPFQQVDVFSSKSCLGNPVAVFLSADDLSTDDMQRIARWTNLSETTFVKPSLRADYSVRIFSPNSELPFAGHPTLGTAWALKQAGKIKENECVQECAFGLINIRFEDQRVFFQLPHYSIQELKHDRDISLAIGAQARNGHLITTGPRWIVAELEGNQDILAFVVNKERLDKLFSTVDSDGITIYHIQDDGAVQVRTFFSAFQAIIEDPVCGSGNAAVGAHIMATGNSERTGMHYEARQGMALQRDGRISVVLGEKIQVGGACNTVFSGTATLTF